MGFFVFLLCVTLVAMRSVTYFFTYMAGLAVSLLGSLAFACDPRVSTCANTQAEQAPKGLDLAVQRYYAGRKQADFGVQKTAQLEAALRNCLPASYRPIMRKVVQHESANHPFAININLGPKLDKQPNSRTEAIKIAKHYIAQGYSVDLGYAQINSQHYAKADGFLRKAGYDVADMFDACTNLRAGALILGEAYLRHGDIRRALSIYNTGHSTKGVENGYVDKVLKAR